MPRILTETPIFRRIAAVSLGTIAGQALVLATLPLVTRLFSPEEIGMANLVVAFLVFATPVMAMRFEGALIVAPDEDRFALLVLSILAGLGMSGLLLGLFMTFQVWSLLGYGSLPAGSFWVVVISLPGLCLFVLGRAVWLRHKKAGLVGAVTFFRAFGQSSGRVFTGLFMGGGLWGLYVGEVLMAWAALPLLPKLIGIMRSWYRPLDRAILRAALRRWHRFPMFELPSTILDNFNLFIIGPLVLTLYGAESAGLFVIAYRVGTLPISQLARSVGEVLHMEFAQARREERNNDMKVLFYRMARIMAKVSVLPAVAFLIGGPLLMGPLLGPEWGASGIVLACMVPWLTGQFIVGPLGRLLLVLERQNLKLTFDLTASVLIFGATALAYYLGLGFIAFILMLSFAMGCAFILYFFIISRAME